MKRYKSKDPLVAFLYLLMRDRLNSGAVESIMEDIEKSLFQPAGRIGGGYTFTNCYLAQHAEDVAKRLRRKP